ncbi:hypothetical protein ONZ51_g8956 [Trametes cubensis]|uniref:Uncharacterized protein n=1 Tax=Trametes cubensis TaxID=1111947 RepID=A0AAD7TM97_9APHY|nr:hypothetical protein ONZ51_g8956 [Trametes cubensis]
MLREEDEGSSRDSDRPQKRRRVAAQPSSPTFILDSRRPITRAQSHRVAPMVTSAESPTASMRVLRTRSQKLPERTPLYPSILSNVTVTRGRSTTRGRDGLFAKRASFATTSTPKKRAMAAVNSPESAAPRFRPVFADIKQAMDGQPRGIACLDDSTDVSEVTFGIDGLTMPLVEQDSSDMDVSSGY